MELGDGLLEALKAIEPPPFAPDVPVGQQPKPTSSPTIKEIEDSLQTMLVFIEQLETVCQSMEGDHANDFYPFFASYSDYDDIFSSNKNAIKTLKENTEKLAKNYNVSLWTSDSN